MVSVPGCRSRCSRPRGSGWALGSSPGGLSTAEAAARLPETLARAIPTGRGRGAWRLLAKQFTSPITLIQPVDDGVYVGTTTELVFMAGSEFDKMTYRQVLAGPVVLGSGVQAPGDLIRGGQPGTAMLCIADGVICVGFNGGNLVRLTEGRYQTDVTEVAATFRMLPGRIPQYLAIPQ